MPVSLNGVCVCVSGIAARTYFAKVNMWVIFMPRIILTTFTISHCSYSISLVTVHQIVSVNDAVLYDSLYVFRDSFMWVWLCECVCSTERKWVCVHVFALVLVAFRIRNSQNNFCWYEITNPLWLRTPFMQNRRIPTENRFVSIGTFCRKFPIAYLWCKKHSECFFLFVFICLKDFVYQINELGTILVIFTISFSLFFGFFFILSQSNQDNVLFPLKWQPKKIIYYWFGILNEMIYAWCVQSNKVIE